MEEPGKLSKFSCRHSFEFVTPVKVPICGITSMEVVEALLPFVIA